MVRALALSVFVACASCRAMSTSSDAPDAATSPQAKAEPAPLVSPPSLASVSPAPGTGEGTHPPPDSMPFDHPLAADVLHEVLREPGGKETTREARDVVGYTLQAVLKAGEGPPAPRAPEVNTAAIDGARRRTETRMTIDLSPSRARFVLVAGFVLPQGTELRARADRYGHLLFWPGERTYRIVQPGTLRALIGERRLDIAPLAPAEVRSGGEGRRLNLHTRHIDVSTRAAKASLEVAAVRDAGEGGALICRFLLDLMSASPSVTPCAADEVPLHAELRWATRGSLTYDAVSIVREVDLSAQDLATPPAGFEFVDVPPADEGSEMLIPKADLAAFRTAAADVPFAAVRDARAPAPDTGLLLINSSDELRVAWVDGVAIGWIAPGERLALASLLRGRYAVQWRTFLGDSWEVADTVVVPGASEVGGLR